MGMTKTEPFQSKHSSAGRRAGIQTIYGADSPDRPETPYMTRIWLGRLRLHIFHRGDVDPDCHDHPWDFWTFPLNSYVEEVATRLTPFPAPVVDTPKGPRFDHIEFATTRQVVPAWRWTFRPAEHCHRVLGPERRHWLWGTKIVTFVWRGEARRSWGFLKSRDGRWCWQFWKDYVYGGGKDAPCSDG